MPEVLSPFVYWAQTENNVTLKVDLKDVKDPDILLEDNNLQFAASGQGAKGPHNYGFTLHFHSPVDPEGSQYRILDREVDFTIKKRSSGWWPRLTCTPQKPIWLKVDFDRWKSEEDDVEPEEEEMRDVMGDYPGVYDRLEKEELGYKKEDMRKVYLAFYNLIQFVGFTYILTVMSIRYFRDGPDSMPGTFEAVGNAFKFCQLLQFLEVMHPLFGYTKGSPVLVALQTSGRAFILFLMIDAEPRMHEKPAVFYLFFFWSLAEIARYPYYIAQIYNKNNGFLTWLRYTIWIPLYPLGFLCEGVIVLRNIPFFEETKRFSVSLPNKWNFAFHFPTALRVYLLLFFFPGIYMLMTHMYRARLQKLGPKKWRLKRA